MIYSDFNTYFRDKSKNAFKKILEMELPNIYKLKKIYKKTPKLLFNFNHLKNPSTLPVINNEFKKYFNNNLLLGYGIHNPINYSTEEGEKSLNQATPVILKLIWMNMKASLVWYDLLIEDGYYIENNFNINSYNYSVNTDDNPEYANSNNSYSAQI